MSTLKSHSNKTNLSLHRRIVTVYNNSDIRKNIRNIVQNNNDK